MNISIIGMPSCGKTTVAKELKNLLKNYILVDIDEKIIQKENTDINSIFKNKGENYFRLIETEILKQVLQFDNQIISTGGGIIKTDENIGLLKEKSVVIYLKAEIETLLERSKNSDERPLLKDCDVELKLNQLLKERVQKYNQAHFVIKTEGKTPESEAKEILEKINEYCRC